MKITSNEKFRIGIFLVLFAIIPFSYMNYSSKFKLENCFKVEGAVKNLSKLYDQGSTQNGWLIDVDSIDYRIRIVGNFYQALDTSRFNLYTKTNNRLTFYMLKNEANGIFGSINNMLGTKDAATIRFNNIEILSTESIRNNLQHLFLMNLSFGLISFGFGVYFIAKSLGYY